MSEQKSITAAHLPRAVDTMNGLMQIVEKTGELAGQSSRSLTDWFATASDEDRLNPENVEKIAVLQESIDTLQKVQKRSINILDIVSKRAEAVAEEIFSV